MKVSFDWNFKLFKCDPYSTRKLRCYKEACLIFGHVPDIVFLGDFSLCRIHCASRSERNDMVRYICSNF